MRLWRVVACALALSVAGTAALAGDPFDSARYYIGVKDNERALELIDSGEFDVNAQTSEGYTLLHYAADAGNLAMVEALLERGADPTIKSNAGSTPAMMAIGTMVQARIKKAAAAWGKGAPAAAAGTGDFDKIRYAIGIKDNAAAIAELDKGIDINMQTDEGYSLLHYAADQGNLAMVKELIRRGADVNLKSARGSTPLDMALGTMVQAEIKKAGGTWGRAAPAKPVPMTPAPALGTRGIIRPRRCAATAPARCANTASGRPA